MKKMINKNDGTIGIIVNYNGYHDTVEAIASILKQSINLKKIIVVDNYSNGDDYKMLKVKYKEIDTVKIIKSNKNGGFSYGNNLGIQYALEHYKFSSILLVNNDTILDKHVNKELNEYYYSKNSWDLPGILTGKIYFYPEKDLLFSGGGGIHKLQGRGYNLGYGKKDTGEYNAEKKITFANGCLMFFHKNLIEKIGYLDEDYFLYSEDTDYSYRVQKAGLKIVYLPTVIIYHKSSRSTNKELANNSLLRFSNNYRNSKNYYIERNQILFVLKNYPIHEKAISIIYYLLKTILGSAKALAKYRKKNGSWQALGDAIRIYIQSWEKK